MRKDNQDEIIITIENGRSRTTSFRLQRCCTGRTPRTGCGNLRSQPKRDNSSYAKISETRQLFTVILSETEFLVVDKSHREVRLFHRLNKKNVHIRSMPI